MLPSNQEMEMIIRVRRHSPTEQPKELIVHAQPLLRQPHIFRGRSLLPAQFTDFLNTSDDEQKLLKGTDMGLAEATIRQLHK